MKPYAESCDQNRAPILAVLREVFSDVSTVLEIGSGTGQHAVYFPRFLSHLNWLASDRAENLPGIRLWLDEGGLRNARQALELDVDQDDWGLSGYAIDGVFSANTAHIMSWDGVANLFGGIGRELLPGGMFALYGPFNYAGGYTSESNARFDDWLRQRDPNSGIRDFEDLQQLAAAAGLTLWRDFAMPANNRTLVWQKIRTPSRQQGLKS